MGSAWWKRFSQIRQPEPPSPPDPAASAALTEKDEQEAAKVLREYTATLSWTQLGRIVALSVALLLVGVFWFLAIIGAHESLGGTTAAHLAEAELVADWYRTVYAISDATDVVLPSGVAALLGLAILSGSSGFVVSAATTIGAASLSWAAISVLSVSLPPRYGLEAPHADVAYTAVALTALCIALATAIAAVLPANRDWRLVQLRARLSVANEALTKLEDRIEAIGLTPLQDRRMSRRASRWCLAGWYLVTIVSATLVAALTSKDSEGVSAVFIFWATIVLVAIQVSAGESVQFRMFMTCVVGLAGVALAIIVVSTVTAAPEWVACALILLGTAMGVLGMWPQRIPGRFRPYTPGPLGLRLRESRVTKQRTQLNKVLVAMEA